MFCPSDVTTGLVQIVGPIQQTDLQHITVQRGPLSISFAPRSTAPTLAGNRIIESSQSDNLCRYKGTKYLLADIQLCAPAHQGFHLPGMTDESVAELILSFESPSNGVLMCLPVYESTVPEHDSYLTQLLEISDPSHPSSVNPPTIQSLFYRDASDMSQTSFTYKTCYETMDRENTPTSHSLYIIVFPHGIRMTPAAFQSLKSVMGGLPDFQVPVPLRGPDDTLFTYEYDDDGNKRSTGVSHEGKLYRTPLSSCSDEFKTRIEYCALPPDLTTQSSNKTAKKLYTKKQYKCVPFDQLRDVSGEYVKLGNKSLDTILQEQQAVQQAADSESGVSGVPGAPKVSTSDQLELAAEIVGTGVAVAVLAFAAYKLWEWKNED